VTRLCFSVKSTDPDVLNANRFGSADLVRDHRNGGWITVFWTQLHRVAAPFGELAWDHAGKLMPGATEAELADAVEDLLTRAGQGPGGAPAGPAAKRERRQRRG
jgi:hypothetical protein